MGDPVAHECRLTYGAPKVMIELARNFRRLREGVEGMSLYDYWVVRINSRNRFGPKLFRSDIQWFFLTALESFLVSIGFVVFGLLHDLQKFLPIAVL